jgi:hypothetical protein
MSTPSLLVVSRPPMSLPRHQRIIELGAAMTELGRERTGRFWLVLLGEADIGSGCSRASKVPIAVIHGQPFASRTWLSVHLGRRLLTRHWRRATGTTFHAGFETEAVLRVLSARGTGRRAA